MFTCLHTLMYYKFLATLGALFNAQWFQNVYIKVYVLYHKCKMIRG